MTQGNGEKRQAYPSAGKGKATTLLKSECIRSFWGLKVYKCLLVFPYLLLSESGKRRLSLDKYEPKNKFSILNYTSKLHLPQIPCFSIRFILDISTQTNQYRKTSSCLGIACFGGELQSHSKTEL